MTTEEIEIIVTAKVEKALKEFEKIVPTINKIVKQVQDAFSKVDTKTMTNKLHQAVNFIKKKMQDLKNSSANNEIAIKVNNKNAQNQISQIQKQIDSLQEKINARQIKLNVITPKIGTFFSAFKQKVEQVKPNIANIGNIFKGLPKITQKITSNIIGMGRGLKQGLGHVLKYAGSLFSLKNIYSVLNNSASSWLSSQNAGAKQLSANIEYMKNTMGSALAPAIQFIIDLVYQLMKAIQSVAYVLTGVNIFANASVGLGKTNNVQFNDNIDSGGIGISTPSFDLSEVDSEMSPLAQKLYDFFKPVKESWDTYGGELISQLQVTAGQVGGLILSVWGSFENIITNGTVYTSLELILSIIGKIAESFSNAWNYNGNGDAIVQNLSNAFNNLLEAIKNVVLSEGFQNWLNDCSDKFRVISEKLAEIDWQPLVDALSNIGQNIGIVALDILSGMVDIFKWLVENPIIAEIILGIAIAIGVLGIAYKIWATATEILTGVLKLLKIEMLPFILTIIAIIVVIALIVVAIINWDNIMNWLKQTVKTVIDAVVGFFTNLWSQVSFIFEAIWNVISTILGFIWNLVKTVFEAIWNIVSPIVNAIWQTISTIFQSIWNILSTILNSIWNIFAQIFNWIWQLISKVFQGIWNIISPIINKIWETIKFVLGKIQEIWSNVWNTISKVVNNVWNGIWSCIKSVINFILGGIEGFVNGTIKGINKLLSGISSVANAVGSLIGLDPINLQISTISLPRLAKGGVLTEATAIIAGEYSGAKSNPEIVTPQNIMRDTFEEVLSDFNSNNGQPLHVTIQYLGKEIFDDTIDYINSRTRRTGKNTIVTVGN